MQTAVCLKHHSYVQDLMPFCHQSTLVLVGFVESQHKKGYLAPTYLYHYYCYYLQDEKQTERGGETDRHRGGGETDGQTEGWRDRQTERECF